jgi:hypothetical protein
MKLRYLVNTDKLLQQNFLATARLIPSNGNSSKQIYCAVNLEKEKPHCHRASASRYSAMTVTADTSLVNVREGL